MGRLWFSYGAPASPRRKAIPQATYFIPYCAKRELAAISWGGDSFVVKFEDDTVWYDIQKTDHGLAVVKLSIDVTFENKRQQEPIGCDITFSSETEGHFDSIMGCWPGASPLRGPSNVKLKSRDWDARPAGEGMGFGMSLGGMSSHTEGESRTSWCFRSKFHASGQLGKSCDTVALTLTAPENNDRASFGGRALYAAAVLKCNHGKLEVKAIGRRTERHGVRARRSYQKPMALFHIGMTKDESAKQCSEETLAGETEYWVEATNTRAIPKEMPNSIPAV